MVARDGDSVGEILAGLAAAAAGSGSRALTDLDINVLLVVVSTGVDNAVSKLVHAVAEGVVVTW